jgi:hypothetical protein
LGAIPYTLLPAGQKFCKLTQNRPNKKRLAGKIWRPYGRRFLDKSGRKKILHEKYQFSLDLLAFVSNGHQNFF